MKSMITNITITIMTSGMLTLANLLAKRHNFTKTEMACSSENSQTVGQSITAAEKRKPFVYQSKQQGVESGIRNTIHIIPDLDGEIYLKSGLQTPPTVDVNGDGTVNILDLVAVANGFGKDTPDVNGDGIVNVLDLVAVANAF